MPILHNWPIRRQVVAITCALLVPFIIAAAWSASRSRAEYADELRDQAASVAATAGAYFNTYLAGLDSMSSALARHPAVMALERSQCDSLFEAVLRDQPLLLNIVVSDTAGVLKGSGVPADSARLSPSSPYVNEVIRTGKPQVSELATGRVSNQPTVVLSYPVRDVHGVLVGVLGLGLNLTRLQTLFSDIPLPEGSVVTLTDKGSRVLARSRDAERYIGKLTGPNPTAPRDVPRTQVRTALDNVERTYGNAVIDRGPWLLSVGIPTSLAAARAGRLSRRNLAIVAVTIGAILLLSLGLSTSMTRGVETVRNAVQRIADGDLSPPERTPVPNRELARLQKAFITMAANLRETHIALDHQVEQERKMRETLQSLQRQVVRQERLAAVGVLVSGVAHELNNPLQAILGTLELLERDRGISAAVLEEIAFVKTQSGRAREIIRNLSRFSSQQSGPPTLVDLREVIGEVVQLRRRDLDTGGIALSVEVQTDRKVYANFTEVEQVTLNFVINAQQSIEGLERSRGRILIRVFDVGKRVRLEVQDDGPGVTQEDEAKLFQPFFTTKPVGKGTGLGLSVSYGIIESYGGTIGHHANQWGGATFFFELPVTEPAARPPASSPLNRSSKPDDPSALLHRPVSPGV
ncbi:MAG TPA: ATP-binding protein [Vicinamibacterales bacterium]|nr:ATP-binding protein [Vicinamibacterales bacterium]